MEAHRREEINVDKKAKAIIKSINRPEIDIDRIMEKSIARVKGLKYTPNHGRPDQDKGLGKEVSNGAL